MRRIAVAALLLASLNGCALVGKDKASCGWGFWMGCPSTINTEMPVLVQQGTPWQTTQSVGTVAGPVAGGQWQSSGGLNVMPAVVGPPAPLAVNPVPATVLPLPRISASSAAPPSKQLSCEELCELIRQVQRQKQSPPAREMPEGPDKE